ncbi:GNAT family N-acetyltransferase [Shewanella abyssi]|uniref:GNAT family N-acetyltransferase n=1 Tax=Shewanella abyssi TaxID=311789 RepID=UPI00200DD28D|nr:GNAT family N-acetyltransferase [Shewanella abyssi]MCL1048040.1 GNAT family N-acetyltransferase [Shewanella abyssi]
MDNKQDDGVQSQSVGSSLSLAFVDAIDAVDASTWDDLMDDGNPFNQHAYLAALEASGCVSQQSGWTPLHLVVRQATRIVAVMPLYIKSHSYGEYIFDWAWAEAYDKHQIPYYPKLVSAIPFTPVTGARIGIATDVTAQQVWELIIQALDGSLIEHGFSSWHCLFLPKEQFIAMSQPAEDNPACLKRLSTQFHWKNRGYQSFDGFLNSLTSRKRKDINKERAKLTPHELSFEFVNAEQVTTAMWHTFYACYRQTYAKRSGHAGYLNLAFFESIANTMPDNVLLLLVRNIEGQVVASALYFKSKSHLYGRYWGSLVDIDGLHFEACYYQGIEYCIEHQLAVFDAGAQGEHKVARGFEPVATYSTHEVLHPEFRRAIESFTLQEADNIKTYMELLTSKLPYRQQAD